MLRGWEIDVAIIAASLAESLVMPGQQVRQAPLGLLALLAPDRQALQGHRDLQATRGQKAPLDLPGCQASLALLACKA